MPHSPLKQISAVPNTALHVTLIVSATEIHLFILKPYFIGYVEDEESPRTIKPCRAKIARITIRNCKFTPPYVALYTRSEIYCFFAEHRNKIYCKFTLLLNITIVVLYQIKFMFLNFPLNNNSNLF